MKSISDTNIIKQFTKPPSDKARTESGTITTFPSSPLDVPASTFESLLKRRQKNHRKLIQWIREHLELGVDYGRVHVVERCQYVRAGIAHHCQNPAHYSSLMLWKAGAEKILGVMGLTAHFPNLNQYEVACVHKQEITQVLLKCELKTLNGKVVAEGSGARHVRQDNWNLNRSVKMASKSALIEATIRVAGLSGVFIKTHRHTDKNKFPGMLDCHGPIPEDKPITQKQKDLVLRLSGIKGLTTEDLNQLVKDHFNKSMDDLNRVEASSFIQQLNDG